MTNGIAWRQLLVAVGIALVLTVAICLLLILIRLEVSIPFFAIVVTALTAAVWLGKRMLRLAARVADPVPVLDVVHLPGRHDDQRVRKLEEFLYGSQPRFDMASNELREVLATLAQDRIAAGADPDRVSPHLRRYLAEPKAPPLTRRDVQQLIKEIAAL